MNKRRGMKHIVSFDKSKIFYRIKRKRKEFIIFLHGLSANNSILRKEELFLRNKSYSTVNIDLRGHGFSENRLKHITLQDFAKDINLILKKEKINKANFVGYSMGGFIALKYYSLFPNKIKRLILIDSSYAANIFTFRPFCIFLVIPIVFLVYLFVNFFKKIPIKDIDFSGNQIKDIYVAYLGALSTKASIAWRSSKSMMKENLKPILKTIKIPTLIIENKQDDIFSKYSYHTLHKNIKRSTLKLERGHHDGVITEPNLIEKDILRFIEKK